MEQALEQCQQNLNLLCYVCGLFTPYHKQVQMSPDISEKYLKAFGKPAVIQNYTPKKMCNLCYTMIWEERYPRNLPSSPFEWNKPNNTHSDCYACLIPNLKKYSWKKRSLPKYPDYPITSCKKPVWSDPSPETLPEPSNENEIQLEPSHEPIPGPSHEPTPGPSHEPQPGPSHEPLPQQVVLLSSMSSGDTISSGEVFQPTPEKVPKLMGQSSFNDFVRDLGIPPNKVELAGSRMREYFWLKKSTRTTFLRRESTFSSLFKNVQMDPIVKAKTRKKPGGESEPYEEKLENTLTYCDNLEALFSEFGQEHQPNQWRLFLDGSTESFKAALLHNENQFPSIVIAYSRHCPERYETMKSILDYIKYNEYEWEVIADFKLINILQGHMAAASKYPCVHCLWEPRYQESDRYTRKWDVREEWTGEPRNNAIKPPLIPRNKMLFPPLHIKIGLVTQLIKKLIELNNDVFVTIKTKILPRLSDAKIIGGVFDGPEIKKIFESKELERILEKRQKEALSRLKQVCANFLGNFRAPDYENLIKDMMESYEQLGCNITIKMHSLISHLDLFKESCGKFSDEQGERIHQTLKKIEQDYKGKNMANGLGLYCFGLIREKDPDNHKRKTNYNRKTEYFSQNKEN